VKIKEEIAKMKSILEELSLGNIHVADRSFKRGSEYDRVTAAFLEASDKFRSELNKSQAEAYDNIMAAQDKVSNMELTDRFIYGFRMGLLIAMEVCNMSDDFIVGGI